MVRLLGGGILVASVLVPPPQSGLGGIALVIAITNERDPANFVVAMIFKII